MILTFRQMPFLARLAAAVTFFNSWVMVGEFVIDRHGLAPYLPFYRVGNLCAWDLAIAILLLTTILWRPHHAPAA